MTPCGDSKMMRLNYIGNCDCLDGLKNVQDDSVDLVVTDPPYRLVAGGSTKGGINNSGILKQQPRQVIQKGMVFKHNSIVFADWIPEVYRVLKTGSHCYIMTNGRNLSELQRECEKSRLIYQNLLVWDKQNVTPSKWYMHRCEFILMLRKGKAKNINNMGMPSLLSIQNNVGRKVHPTEKPVDLMQILVENSTQVGDVVLDPFMGSGTTAVACLKTGRNYIGFELDEKYHAIAMQRIANTERKNKLTTSKQEAEQ